MESNVRTITRITFSLRSPYLQTQWESSNITTAFEIFAFTPKTRRVVNAGSRKSWSRGKSMIFTKAGHVAWTRLDRSWIIHNARDNSRRAVSTRSVDECVRRFHARGRQRADVSRLVSSRLVASRSKRAASRIPGEITEGNVAFYLPLFFLPTRGKWFFCAGPNK